MKLTIALLGVSIIFLTTIEKEIRRDKFKDLADAIDKAEDAFLTRNENHDTMSQIRGFEREFVEFEAHPTKARTEVFDWGDTDFGDDKQVDFTALDEMRDEGRENNDVLDTMERLVRALPKENRVNEMLNGLEKRRNDFWERCQEAQKEAIAVVNHPPDLKAIAMVNKKIRDAHSLVISLALDMVGTSSDVWDAAELERSQAEEDYKRWLKITLSLYGVGAVITAIGLLLGVEEEDLVDAES